MPCRWRLELVGRRDRVWTGRGCILMHLGWMGGGGMGRMLGRWACMIALVTRVVVWMMSLGLAGEGGKMNRMLGRWVCAIAPVKEKVACMMNLGLLTAVACTRGRFPVA